MAARFALPSAIDFGHFLRRAATFVAVCLMVALATACVPQSTETDIAGSRVSQKAPTHRIDGGTFLLLKGTGWTAQKARAWAKHLPGRLATCGIQFGQPEIVLTDRPPPPPSPLWERQFKKLAQDYSNLNRPLFIFTDALGTSGDVGGAALIIGGNEGVAVIARKNPTGRRYAAEQTLAHELGHLLGLKHSPARTRGGTANIDMMTPRGCLYCSFTAEQCALMRGHPLVRPLEPAS